MRFTRTLVVAVTLAAAAACSKKDPAGPSKRGQPVVTTMTCDKGNGQRVDCEIPLTNAGSFTITLVSTDCEAQGNILRLTKPTPTELTTNGCFETLGKEWTITGPFTGSATMAMEVSSKYFASPPQLRVTQNGPTKWTVVFEDGYDDDFNDMVFTVTTAS